MNGKPTQTTLGFNWTGIRNWLILGAFVAGGYYLWQKFYGPGSNGRAGTLVPSGSGGPAVPGPDLNGPLVGKGALNGTKSPVCISQKAPGMVYAPVVSVVGGVYNFRSPVNGRFTRRMLCIGSQKSAEIKPN